MEQVLVAPLLRAWGWAALIVSALFIAALAAAAEPQSSTASQDADPLSEVVVTASKLPGRH